MVSFMLLIAAPPTTMLQPRTILPMGATQVFLFTTLLVTALWPNPNGLIPGASCDPLPLTSSSSFSQVTINFRCPEQFGYYADEYNCSKYFVCVFGEALHESCTGGLRFSSELQTCDWPRNVVCPSEDSEYEEGENDSHHHQGGHAKQQASGVVAELPGTTAGTPLGGYVMLGKPPSTTPHHEPVRSQHYSTTTPAPSSFTTELNEAALQESYDKLIKKNQRNHKHVMETSHFGVARPVDSINYLDLNSNKLDSNGTHDGDLTGDELDENFTLVDLQRSGVSLGGGKLGRTPKVISSTLNDNVLGTVGRSVNGENRAQSVSVVASTSSEAVIPELNFVFKKPHEKVAEKHAKSHGTGANNRILLDELLHVSNYRGGEGNSQTSKFEEAITTIVDENGSVQLDGEDGPALFRIMASPNNKNLEANSLPGTAASNRNTASQQVALPKNYHELAGSDEQDKFMYQQTSQPKRSKVESEFDSATIKTAKSTSQSNTILVFNRTQLVGITSNSVPDSKMKNSSATLILIDHQQPTATVLDGRESLLSGFNADRDDEQSTHRMSDKKRQPIVIRTDKDSIDAQDSYGRMHGYNMASMAAQGNKSSLYVGYKDRHKPSAKQHVSIYSTTPPVLMDNEDDMEILVNIPSSPSQETINDFQRIHSALNSSMEKKHNKNSGWRPIPNFKHQNNTNQASIYRNPSGHHLGSHQRSNAKSTLHNSTSRSNKNLALQVPSRPSPLYPEPEAYSSSTKCNEHCRLPDCFCGGTDIPGGLPVNDVPQLVLISFDDAVNDVNWHIYEELLNSGRSNPNGCPIKATFYVSHEWTDYSQVQTLYSRGHEISSHSITHTFGERFTKQQWHKEIAGQREILHLYGGVNRADIRGMRAPFLQAGGNKQFEMLHEDNFTYDSSMPVFENSPPFWPYTLDYSINHECMIAPCPTKSFPGLWEIGLVMWQDLRGGRCSMGDACSNPSDENGVYDMIMKNFKRHYESNRAPFGLYYHSAWFNSDHHRRGFLRVIDDLLTVKDVYFVTKWELIQWIRNPTPLKELYRVNLFGCARDPHRPPPCLHPNICNVGFHSGSRFLKTCQPCPKRYPWLDDTGQ